MYGCVSRTLYNCGKTFYRSQSCRHKVINNGNSFGKLSISYCRPNNLNKKLTETEREDEKSDEHNLPSALADKYKVFRDEDAPIIFDVNEERKRIALTELDVEVKEDEDPYADVNMRHGINGVYEIEDLVKILKRDKAKKVFVASVPKEYSYVDYIVVVSGKSPKHMLGLATLVRKVFKLKKHSHEITPKIEGENSKEWIALDLGNIALHIFSKEAREKYDLETLWAIGSEYDDLCNKPEDEDIMDKYKSFLKNLQPAE